MCEFLKIYWGVMAIAEELKNNGYLVGIISNHSKFWFEHFFNRFHMEDIFNISSLVIPSYKVALDKPNIEIYKTTFERIKNVDSQINPNNVLFIDDKDRNLITAKGILQNRLISSNFRVWISDYTVSVFCTIFTLVAK